MRFKRCQEFPEYITAICRIGNYSVFASNRGCPYNFSQSFLQRSVVMNGSPDGIDNLHHSGQPEYHHKEGSGIKSVKNSLSVYPGVTPQFQGSGQVIT